MKPVTPIRTDADAAAQAEKMAEDKRQHRMLYGRVFGTPDGKRVLADLMKRYGWDEDGVELACFQPGMAPTDAIHRDGMKEPVRYISRMIAGKTNPTEA